MNPCCQGPPPSQRNSSSPRSDAGSSAHTLPRQHAAPPGLHPAPRIQQLGTSHVMVHPPPNSMSSTGTAACPGSPAYIPAALEQAGQREAEHQPPPGTLPFPAARNRKEAGSWPCAVTAQVPTSPPYLLHLFPIKASFQSVQEKVLLPLLPNAIVFPRCGK